MLRRIAVLAVQGGFLPHVRRIEEIGLEAIEVRAPKDLDRADGLVLPGGESTAQLRLIERFELWPALDRFVRSGKPVLATCAGLILAAREVIEPAQKSFGWIDVKVARNAFGRQLDSFEALSDRGELPLIFIRAPRILSAGRGVEIITTLRAEPVLVRSGSLWGATFHPELTRDSRVHRLIFCGLQASVGPVGSSQHPGYIHYFRGAGLRF
jgi:pyridoxal 5'-phosphate synthase pdxT subunit